MIQRSQASSRVKLLPFYKKGAYGVKRAGAILLTELVQRFKYGLVEVAFAEVSPLVFRGRITRRLTNFQIGSVGGTDQIQMLGINQIQAVSQIYNSPQHGGRFHFAIFLTSSLLAQLKARE